MRTVAVAILTAAATAAVVLALLLPGLDAGARITFGAVLLAAGTSLFLLRSRR